MVELLPLKNRLKEAQNRHKSSWEIVEKDYLLSWILYAISKHSISDLVFKGGTALKKCYFGEYRFSEDLDFTSKDSNISYESLMTEISDEVENSIREFEQFEISCERYQEKDPHPQGQEAYLFKAKFRWHRSSHIRLFVEITKNEPLFYAPVQKAILHEYGELFDSSISVYSLEEIIVEKMRGVLQHTKKIHERQWTRSRARDYYDLWRIFKSYPNHIHTLSLKSALEKKCVLKDVEFHDSSSFFDAQMIEFVSRTWERWLEPLVPNLPDCKIVLSELRAILSAVIDEK